MTVPYIVMLSGAKHLRERRFFANAQNDRKITLRMTVPFMVMLSWSETSQRFFGTYVPQNDRKKNAQNDV